MHQALWILQQDLTIKGCQHGVGERIRTRREGNLWFSLSWTVGMNCDMLQNCQKKGHLQLLHLYNRSGTKMMKTEKMGNLDIEREWIFCALRFEEKPRNLLCKLLPWTANIFAWGKFEGEWKHLKWEVEVLTSAAASTLFLFPWDKWSDNWFL